MLEVLTNSGAVITLDDLIPANLAALKIAVEAFGGIVAEASLDADTDTVLSIMDQNVTGTTLTAEDGTVYELWSSGWINSGPNQVPIPPYETIISATMPGGWSWNK